MSLGSKTHWLPVRDWPHRYKWLFDDLNGVSGFASSIAAAIGSAVASLPVMVNAGLAALATYTAVQVGTWVFNTTATTAYSLIVLPAVHGLAYEAPTLAA